MKIWCINMARYEQYVVVYATVSVEAKNKREAEKEIDRIIEEWKEKASIFPEHFLVGDVARVSEVMKD